MAVIQPFRVAISQAALADLLDRLQRVRWTEELPNGGWDFGVPVDYVKSLTERWRTRFDWRAQEARLNAYPQFTTRIDGQTIHFLHAKSREPGARALLLLHGWPGSIFEYLDVIEPLTAPVQHCGQRRDAYDVVIPSLPGFAFSGPTHEAGWNVSRMARALVELMARLGYEHYGVVGNDWGSVIAPEMWRVAPDAVTAAHVTQIFAGPSGAPGELDGLTGKGTTMPIRTIEHPRV